MVAACVVGFRERRVSWEVWWALSGVAVGREPRGPTLYQRVVA